MGASKRPNKIPIRTVSPKSASARVLLKANSPKDNIVVQADRMTASMMLAGRLRDSAKKMV